MARNKFDGVIDAVRYGTDGRITCVAAYERRGAVWSDRVLLEREELAKRLKQGKRFAAGKRKTYMGSQFETGPSVHLVGGVIVTGRQDARQDLLDGVPIF